MHHLHFVEEANPHHEHRQKRSNSQVIRDPHHSPHLSAYTPSNPHGGQKQASQTDVIVSQTAWETQVHKKDSHPRQPTSLEKKLKMTLYFLSLILFLTSMAISLTMIFILDRRIINYLPKITATQKILNGLPRLLYSMPFYNLYVKDRPCDEFIHLGWQDDDDLELPWMAPTESVVVYSWPGTNYGCLCQNGEVYFGNTCKSHPDCHKIPTKPPMDLYLIDENKYICGQRYRAFYEIDPKSEKCSEEAPFLVGSKYCADTNVLPVTDFSMRVHNQGGVIGHLGGVHSVGKRPIIGVEGYITKPGKSLPCIDPDRLPLKEFSQPYEFLRKSAKGCNEYGQRTWDSEMNFTTNVTRFFEVNNIISELQELKEMFSPKYLDNRENITFYLTRVPYVSAKAACKNLTFQEQGENEETHAYEMQRKAKDITIMSALALGFSVIGILLVLLITFVAAMIKYTLLLYIIAILLAIILISQGIYFFVTRRRGVAGERRESYQNYLAEGCLPDGFTLVADTWIETYDQFMAGIDGLIIGLFVFAIIYLIVLITVSSIGEKNKTRPILKRAPTLR